MKNLVVLLAFLALSLSSCAQEQKNEKSVQELNERATNLLMPNVNNHSYAVDSAIIYLQRALKIDSTKKILFSNLSAAYAKKGNYQAMVELYDRYLQIYPNDINGVYQQALGYLCLGEERKAMKNLKTCNKYYKEAIKQKNRKEDIVNRAYVLLLMDEEGKAYKLLNTSVKDYPELQNFVQKIAEIDSSQLLPCSDKLKN